jgi:hypothetical protein
MVRYPVLLTLTVLFTLSCSVQKRKYQDGYFVEWHKRNNEHKESKLSASAKTRVSKDISENNTKVDEQEHFSSGLVKPGSSSFASQIINTPHSFVSDSCDLLYLKDSSRLYCKVLEIHESFIRYKACNTASNKVKRMSKVKIAQINYSNGSKEVVVYQKPHKKKKKPMEPLAFTSSFFGPISFGISLMTILIVLLGAQFIVLAIPAVFCAAAILTAVFSLIKLKRNPDTYRGKRQAKIGLFFGILAFVALFSILMSILGGYLI